MATFKSSLVTVFTLAAGLTTLPAAAQADSGMLSKVSGLFASGFHTVKAAILPAAHPATAFVAARVTPAQPAAPHPHNVIRRQAYRVTRHGHIIIAQHPLLPRSPVAQAPVAVPAPAIMPLPAPVADSTVVSAPASIAASVPVASLPTSSSPSGNARLVDVFHNRVGPAASATPVAPADAIDVATDDMALNAVINQEARAASERKEQLHQASKAPVVVSSEAIRINPWLETLFGVAGLLTLASGGIGTWRMHKNAVAQPGGGQVSRLEGRSHGEVVAAFNRRWEAYSKRMPDFGPQATELEQQLDADAMRAVAENRAQRPATDRGFSTLGDKWRPETVKAVKQLHHLNAA